MDIQSVCILGGSGFVGASIADQACARGYRVRVVTRSAQRARHVLVLPTCEVAVADPHDDASLASALDNMDAVVNLVGILHEGRGASFRAVHAELPRRLAMAAHTAGVRQILHMSALGASPSGPSAYLRSKAEGEAALRETADVVPWTIFRPSVIFGERDRFLNLFAALVRFFPVIPLGAATARFQPVWVEDVARCYVAAIGNPAAARETYELCGPRAYTLEELVRYVAQTLGRRRAIVPLPASVATLQAFVFEHLPGKLLTRDNLRSMSVDNVCAGPFPRVFGFEPSALEAVVPDYITGAGMRARYNEYRHLAGR